MKRVIENRFGLSESEVDETEDRVKVLIINSKKEILLCKVNGVYHFIGGHIEDGEKLRECARREVMEETGIVIDSLRFRSFLQLQKYEKNYYNTGDNYFTTINYMDVITDIPFCYDKQQLDDEESKKRFELKYIPIGNIISELEKNRECAKKDNREFIIDEMKYVLSEYNKYLEKIKDEKDIDR